MWVNSVVSKFLAKHNICEYSFLYVFKLLGKNFIASKWIILFNISMSNHLLNRFCCPIMILLCLFIVAFFYTQSHSFKLLYKEYYLNNKGNEIHSSWKTNLNKAEIHWDNLKCLQTIHKCHKPTKCSPAGFYFDSGSECYDTNAFLNNKKCKAVICNPQSTDTQTNPAITY